MLRLSLLVRDITATSLRFAAPAAAPRTAVAIDPTVAPTGSGTIEIQADRFDPLAGRQFTRLLRIPVGGSALWTPPAEGT